MVRVRALVTSCPVFGAPLEVDRPTDRPTGVGVGGTSTITTAVTSPFRTFRTRSCRRTATRRDPGRARGKTSAGDGTRGAGVPASPHEGSAPEADQGCPRQDSNLRFRLRRPTLYPLSYGGALRCDRSDAPPGEPARDGPGDAGLVTVVPPPRRLPTAGRRGCGRRRESVHPWDGTGTPGARPTGIPAPTDRLSSGDHVSRRPFRVRPRRRRSHFQRTPVHARPPG